MATPAAEIQGRHEGGQTRSHDIREPEQAPHEAAVFPIEADDLRLPFRQVEGTRLVGDGRDEKDRESSGWRKTPNGAETRQEAALGGDDLRQPQRGKTMTAPPGRDPCQLEGNQLGRSLIRRSAPRLEDDQPAARIRKAPAKARQ
jgi:hypothetical protein